MKSFKEYLDEAKTKSFIGSVGDQYYALKLNDVPSDYPKMNFGHQLSYRKSIEQFKNNAKKTYISTKEYKNYNSAIKAWMKLINPSEFYGIWKAPSKFYKDDSLEIYYTE